MLVFAGISSGSVNAFSRVGGGVHQSPVDREPVGANLELGELEQLTITNDNESSSYDVSCRISCRKSCRKSDRFTFLEVVLITVMGI